MTDLEFYKSLPKDFGKKVMSTNVGASAVFIGLHEARKEEYKDRPGEISQEAQTGACHANVKYMETRPSSVICMMKEPVYRKGAEIWLDYLLNRSPFADAYLSKDPVEALERQAVLVGSDTIQSVHLAALQMSRLSTGEYGHHYTALLGALELGLEVNPLLLLWLIVSYVIKIEKGGFVTTRLDRPNYLYGGNHLPFPYQTEFLEHCLPILRNEPRKGVKESTFAAKGVWSGNLVNYWGWEGRGRGTIRMTDFFNQLTYGPQTFVEKVENKEEYSDPWLAATSKFTQRLGFVTNTEDFRGVDMTVFENFAKEQGVDK